MASIREVLVNAWSAVARAVAPPMQIEVSASMQAAHSGAAEYDPEHAASAIGAYPWARVGVEAIAANASQVPIRVYDPSTRKPITDHWMVDLLRRPSPNMGQKRWRRQIVADFKSAGYLVCTVTRIGDPNTGRVVRMRRRHPRGWSVEVDAKEDPIAYIDGRGVRYDPGQVFVVADISWRDDPALQHLGESPIRSLDLGIRAAIDSRRQAGRAAKLGRLELLISSLSPLGAGGAKRISERIDDIRRAGTGTLVAGHNLKVQPLSLAPRDTEWARLDERTSDEVLSVLGVPPVRAQRKSANYGAAKQEMRQYWENIRALTDLIDEELTELARGEVVVAHSYESVEALQTSYTERLTRAKMWVDLGATPWEAARAEGFADPPLTPSTVPRTEKQNLPAHPDTQTATPQARSMEDQALEALRRAAEWMQDRQGVASDPATMHALADMLRASPLAPLADTVSEHLALAVHHATGASDAGIDCATLPAFGREHARLLADTMGAP